MKRAVIIAKGEVQRVGYRDTVEKIARKLKLTGFVENLKPYEVRIVAEGEQDTFDEFITQINIGDHPISSISVEDLDARFETATGEFEYFEIKRGATGRMNSESAWMQRVRFCIGLWNLERSQWRSGRRCLKSRIRCLTSKMNTPISSQSSVIRRCRDS